MSITISTIRLNRNYASHLNQSVNAQRTSLLKENSHETQNILATHLNGQPLAVEHGAPLRLLAPVKLGLKNVKAVTKLTYVAEELRDYWAERGYSRYDGI